ncbi:MAG: fimbrillin family protein [Prevotella sp.]|nr:fimbrillin family protein [Prevotella sp.]
MNKTNKFLFILGVATALFTSCSSDDTLETSKGPELTEDEKWVLEANSVERIQLGSGDNSFTRAFVEGDNNNLFETNEGIGVFCLASEVKQGTGSITWNTYDTSEEGRYMNWMGMNPAGGTSAPINYHTWGGNVKANAKKVTVGEGAPYTRIAWDDNFTRFYPMGNLYAYTFYGYHPYQENVTTGASTVNVDIPIKGYTDVLWGRTYRPTRGTTETVSVDEFAYSGKYFRQYRKAHGSEALIPVMKFKHSLSRINFYVAKGDNRPGTLYIKEMTLLGYVDDKVRLKVADQSTAAIAEGVDETAAGTVIIPAGTNKLTTTVTTGQEWNAETGTLDFITKTKNGVEVPYAVTWNPDEKKNDVTKLSSQNSGKGVQLNYHDPAAPDDPYDKLGPGIIVPPTTTDPGFSIQLTIVYVAEDGKEYTFIPQVPYTVSFPDNKLLPGNQYNLRLTIYSPEEIVINAELEPWKDADMDYGEDNTGIEI